MHELRRHSSLGRCLLRLLFAFTVFTCLLSAEASAVFTFTFDRAFMAPEDNAFALGAGDDGSIWMHGQTTKLFYELDPVTGAVIQSFAGPGVTVNDVDVRGGIVYGAGEPDIFRFDTATGADLGSIDGPVTGGARGLTFIGPLLYVSGVLVGLPSDVRVGEVDPSTGSLLGSSDPVDLIESHGIGAIGGFVAYLFTDTDTGDAILHIADPVTGDLLETHVLFEGEDGELYSLDVLDDELFVSRRDVGFGEVWVYNVVPEPSQGLLLGAGLLALAGLGRGRRRSGSRVA